MKRIFRVIDGYELKGQIVKISSQLRKAILSRIFENFNELPLDLKKAFDNLLYNEPIIYEANWITICGEKEVAVTVDSILAAYVFDHKIEDAELLKIQDPHLVVNLDFKPMFFSIPFTWSCGCDDKNKVEHPPIAYVPGEYERIRKEIFKAISGGE